MKLGVDFGTNRTVVAAADRGNYPLVSFEAPDGTTPDWFPSLVALCGSDRCYGWEAWDLQADESWTVIRSIKRLLDRSGPQTVIDLGDDENGNDVRVSDALHGFTAALYKSLREASNLRLKAGEDLEIVLGVPANANSNQRFLTIDAFRSAGFHVMGVLNEPSAAAIEFGHRQRQTKAGRETILVYDLGGGTFDASLVALDDGVHHVIGTEGIASIGGDDFDHLLADLALEAAGIDIAGRDRISASAWFRLLEECRTRKEALNPNSRRISVDLEHANPHWQTVQISVSDFYEAARPLVDETIHAAEDLAAKFTGDVEAFYVTGGGSELPLVTRALKEHFGRRVRRSVYTRAATAIGLAIQAGQPDTYRLSDQLTRFFGVWREGESGSRIVFDPLFEKGISLPAAGTPPLRIQRAYSPVHNIGHFRFLECSHRAADGSPSGEITVWDEVRFPFDPVLESTPDMKSLAVTYCEAASTQQVEEFYECDSGGSIAATIVNRSSGYRRSYPLGRWSFESRQVKPADRRARKTAQAGKE